MPLPEQTFNDYDDLRAYINTYITSNGGRDITGTEHNNVENALLTFIISAPLNNTKVDIHSTGGSYTLSRGISLFNIVTPTLLSFADNVQHEWYIVNATSAPIPLASDSYYFSMQTEQTAIPAMTTIHIAKSENDQWLQVNNSEVEGIGISGYSGVSGYSGTSGFSGYGFSGYSGYSGKSGYSGAGSSGYSGFSGATAASGYSGFSGTGGSGYSGFSGGSGYSGFSGSGVSGYSGYSGKSGYSGFSGAGNSGYSGFSGGLGLSGYSGFSGSGVSGYSGYSGVGSSGFSGFSGANPGASGYSGYSGPQGPGGGDSGFSGKSGYSGFSGLSGYSGFSGSGISGYSGYSGSGTSGYSGFSGKSGYSGYSGQSTSGYSGFSGATAASGYSGFSGGSGYSGFSGSGISGYSGYSGKSGYSGYSGFSGSGGSGFSGYSGGGVSGYSGYSGFSGKSGYSGFSGNGQSGYSGYSGTNGAGSGDVLLRSLSALRAETSTSTSVRYYMTDLGKEGMWYYDSTDTTTADNTALVVVSGSRRYKRIYNNVSVDVKWFNIVGDGSNETTAFQFAIDNTNGKELLIQNITITFDLITISGANRKITGNNGTLRKLIPGISPQPAIFIYAGSVNTIEISGLNIDMNHLPGDAFFGTTAFQFDSCSYVKVHHNKMYDNGHAWIKVVLGNRHVIESNQFLLGDAAIFMFGTLDFEILNNLIDGGTSEGIGVITYASNGQPEAERYIVAGNIILNKDSYAFSLAASRNGIYSNNLVDSCLGGAFLQACGDIPGDVFSYDLQFSDNKWSNLSFGYSNVGDYCTITGDTFKNIKYSAIMTNDYCWPSPILSTGVNITSCKFYNCAYLAPEFPIIILQNIRGSVISNNIFMSSASSEVQAIKFKNIGDCAILDNYASDSKLTHDPTDTGSYALRNLFRGNTFLSATNDVTYPITGNIYNWIWEGNRWRAYDNDPTLFYYDLTVTSGALNGINDLFIRDNYYIAASTTVTSIAPSWFGRTIIIEAKGAATFNNGSNISNISGANVTLSAGQSIMYRYDLTKWRQILVALS